MGHEIVYCARCQTRILGTELEKGKAFAFSNRFCCGACAPEFLKSLPHAERAELLSALQRAGQEARTGTSSSAQMRPPTARVPILEESTTRRRLTARPKSAGPAVGIGVAIAVVVAAVTFVLLPGPRPAPPPERPAAAAPAPAPPAPPPPTEKPKAVDALREARDFERRQPGDLDGRIQRWEKAVWACEGGAGLEEAKSGLAAALAARKEAVARELPPLEAEVGAILAKESFRTALDVLDAARKRYAHPEWTLAVDKRISELRARVAATFDAVHAEVSTARAAGDEARIRAAAERVERWGLPDYSSRIRPFLTAAPAPAPVPAPAPAASPYPPIWEKAMAFAARRDYAAAAKELALQPDGVGDLDLLKKAGAIPAEAREAIGRWTRGQKQAIGYFDAAGRISRLEAPFLKIEDARLIFGAGDETRAVDVGELAPSTLAALYLARPKKAEGDERAALAFCLIEGDLEGPKAAVDAKYWDWARKAAAERGAGRDAEARAIYASALEDAEDPAKALASAAALKDLVARFADTPFVARNRGAVELRTSIPRDQYVFSDWMSGTGAFRLAKPAKGDAAWACEADGAANFVEFSYAAPPNAELRGWVYAGACCLETFEFGIQATGLRAPDAKNPKELVAADPGAPGFAVAKIPFFLRKTHASHGGPKTAARWEWIQIPLPKSGEGGPKTVRLLSAHQGFAVAYAVVSAAPDFTPRLSDVKERERARAARLRSPGPPPDAGLVGHWAFDDGQGAKAADSSPRGHHGALVGAVWTQGKFGGGLRFDGDNSHVELPSTPSLDGLQKGDYTLSAWFKPEGVPPGRDSANDAVYGIVIKRGMHIGLAYGGHQAFSFNHYVAPDVTVASGSGVCPPGAFYHVAAAFSRKSGQLRFYLNGQLTGAGAFTPDAAAREFGTEPWRIGIGLPGAETWRWPAKGVIDEVRMYDRALLAWEIRALAGPRPAAPPADTRPWTAVQLETFSGFRFENGVLANIPGVDNAARSAQDFGDVELRIRFEHAISGYMFFAVRQCAEGAYTAQWGRGQLAAMALKEHELIFVCKGDAVTATLDGATQELVRNGTPKSGRLQFNINGSELKIKSVEYRDPR
ncbi:MAG TPA: LamG domain-containing protein [Planctomycetota bacterium]